MDDTNNPSTPSITGTVQEIPIDELKARVESFVELIKTELAARFGRFIKLSAKDRTSNSEAHFRDGEAELFLRVLDVADKPEYTIIFKKLAQKDHGQDPKKFETRAIREFLLRVILMEKLRDALETPIQGIKDTILYNGIQCRKISLDAYKAIKPYIETDAELMSLLNPLVDIYEEPARKAQETRAANQRAQEEKTKIEKEENKE